MPELHASSAYDYTAAFVAPRLTLRGALAQHGDEFDVMPMFRMVSPFMTALT